MTESNPGVTMPRHTFVDFVGKFPPVTMPVTLSYDDHHTFSTENEPLPETMIEQFILPFDNKPADEFTEFVPCFAIDCEEKFVALVWWRAGLLIYEYFLATYSEKGEIIDQKVIAFTRVNGNKVRRAVATIDSDLGIQIIEGTSENDIYDAGSSKTVLMEVMPNGMIVSGL
jgi:hypothetical protein